MNLPASAHKMSITALVDAQQLPVAPQQQQQPALALPLAASGSISPVTAGTKVQRKRKRAVGPKRPRKSRVIYNFTRETLEQYFHLSQRDAAKLLGVAPITMKRNCKRQGILWPYRAKKIEAAHRARQQQHQHQQEADLPSEAESAVNDNDDSDSDDSEDGNASSVSECSAPEAGKERAGHTAMSEAAQMFARLPFLCLADEHVE